LVAGEDQGAAGSSSENTSSYINTHFLWCQLVQLIDDQWRELFGRSTAR